MRARAGGDIKEASRFRECFLYTSTGDLASGVAFKILISKPNRRSWVKSWLHWTQEQESQQPQWPWDVIREMSLSFTQSPATFPLGACGAASPVVLFLTCLPVASPITMAHFYICLPENVQRGKGTIPRESSPPCLTLNLVHHPLNTSFSLLCTEHYSLAQLCCGAATS